MQQAQQSMRSGFKSAAAAAGAWRINHEGRCSYAMLMAVYSLCCGSIESGRTRALMRLCDKEPEAGVSFKRLVHEVLVACGVEDRRVRYKLGAVAQWAYEADVMPADLERRVRSAGGLNACAARSVSRSEEGRVINSWL